MLPRTNTSGPTPKAVKQPHTITPPSSNFLVDTIHSGRNHSPGRRHTHACPSDRNNVILVSSLHRTDFHCSSIQLRRSKHHLSRRALLLVVVWGLCATAIPKYPSRVLRFLSVKIGGRPERAALAECPLIFHLRRTNATVDLDLFSFLAIARLDSPLKWQPTITPLLKSDSSVLRDISLSTGSTPACSTTCLPPWRTGFESRLGHSPDFPLPLHSCASPCSLFGGQDLDVESRPDLSMVHLCMTLQCAAWTQQVPGSSCSQLSGTTSFVSRGRLEGACVTAGTACRRQCNWKESAGRGAGERRPLGGGGGVGKGAASLQDLKRQYKRGRAERCWIVEGELNGAASPSGPIRRSPRSPELLLAVSTSYRPLSPPSTTRPRRPNFPAESTAAALSLSIRLTSSHTVDPGLLAGQSGQKPVGVPEGAGLGMAQRRNERTGETEYPRENPPTSGIVGHDSHMRKSGIEPASLGGAERALFCGRGLVALRRASLMAWSSQRSANTTETRAEGGGGGGVVYRRTHLAPVCGKRSKTRREIEPRKSFNWGVNSGEVTLSELRAFQLGPHWNARAGETGVPRENPTASSSTIPTCGNPRVNPPGIEPGLPWWSEVSALSTAPPLPPVTLLKNYTSALGVNRSHGHLGRERWTPYVTTPTAPTRTPVDRQAQSTAPLRRATEQRNHHAWSRFKFTDLQAVETLTPSQEILYLPLESIFDMALPRFFSSPFRVPSASSPPLKPHHLLPSPPLVLPPTSPYTLPHPPPPSSPPFSPLTSTSPYTPPHLRSRHYPTIPQTTHIPAASSLQGALDIVNNSSRPTTAQNIILHPVISAPDVAGKGARQESHVDSLIRRPSGHIATEEPAALISGELYAGTLTGVLQTDLLLHSGRHRFRRLGWCRDARWQLGKVGWTPVGTVPPRSRSEGAIRATLTRTSSASSLLRARRAVFPSTKVPRYVVRHPENWYLYQETGTSNTTVVECNGEMCAAIKTVQQVHAGLREIRNESSRRLLPCSSLVKGNSLVKGVVILRRIIVLLVRYFINTVAMFVIANAVFMIVFASCLILNIEFTFLSRGSRGHRQYLEPTTNFSPPSPSAIIILLPEKTRRPATSSGTIPTCENPPTGNRTRFA
ncbi:hypothetical protein PR048_029206 [Dryococelus australis]|uniref:Uncharacterized protein n=1 Tax=Dryococelus australis TaxID=614101 RepID=A0ABQ9GCP8_9NEOP|nr:hypothetical protein PR048_029206 [Dryococelus australis]